MSLKRRETLLLRGMELRPCIIPGMKAFRLVHERTCWQPHQTKSEHEAKMKSPP